MKNALCQCVCWLLAIAAASCSSATTASRDVPREPPSLSALERLAAGTRTPLPNAQLPNAQLFVPEGFRPEATGRVPLYVHFQGGTTIAEENFARMQSKGVLIASTLSGRSSAFSRSYSDPAAFRRLLSAAEGHLSAQFGRDLQVGPIVITFFSAGYGAVRELLKEPEFFDRIDALVSADSIYASVVQDDVRAPLAEHMIDLLRFAQAAVRGEKTFVLAHGMFQTEYASTAECADMILASVAGKRKSSDAVTARGVPIAAEFHHGGMHVYTFDEATPGIHVDCLYMVPELVRRHVAN